MLNRGSINSHNFPVQLLQTPQKREGCTVLPKQKHISKEFAFETEVFNVSAFIKLRPCYQSYLCFGINGDEALHHILRRYEAFWHIEWKQTNSSCGITYFYGQQLCENKCSKDISRCWNLQTCDSELFRMYIMISSFYHWGAPTTCRPLWWGYKGHKDECITVFTLRVPNIQRRCR